MNLILSNLIDKRPPAPYIDPTLTAEKEMIKQTLYDSILYIETGGKGYRDATDDERAASNDKTERVLNIMRKLQPVISLLVLC